MSSATGLARFPDFQSDPTASLVDDFRRLALQEGWAKKSKTYKEERRAYLAEAVEIRFLSQFGVNASSLQAWQSLCRTIGVAESVEGGEVDLTSIRKCQAVRALLITFSVLLTTLPPRSSSKASSLTSSIS
jgi:hypothetical protein